MIIELRIKNCFAFNEQVTFSMEADMRSKKFASNVHRGTSFNVLKTAGVYGPNNSGKTCLTNCIQAIKLAMQNKNPKLLPNMFTDNDLCELGITFQFSEKIYSYDFKFDEDKEEYTYEKFMEISRDQYGNEKEDIWLCKDTKKESYFCKDKSIESMIPVFSRSKLLCYLIDVDKFENMELIKNIITEFSSKIDIINMNDIPIEKTIDLMKNKNDLQIKVVNFIKNADIYMDNFEYLNWDEVGIRIDREDNKTDEKELDISEIPEKLLDQIRLASTYKGVRVPSIIFDSTGTKKITALAGYIMEALEKGRVLVVDELDSSIHFKITRAIVAMFNNELNTNAQMIFTVHDINLMDCKRLFRKEQIWFIHKDDDAAYVYSLGDYTAAAQGIRDTTDIIEKYKKGVLGALPEPELINSLLSIKGQYRNNLPTC